MRSVYQFLFSLLLILGLEIVLAGSSYAQETPLDPMMINHLQIKSVELSDLGEASLTEAEISQFLSPRARTQNATLDEAEVVIDKIINIGKKIWAIVDAGKPVVNLNLNSASALPAGMQAWQSMENWQLPTAKRYQVLCKNLFGATVVNFTYKIISVYGGSYQGKGKYLAQAKVIPESLDVAWGYRFDSNVEVPLVYNMGTSVDPIAAVQLTVQWKINTALKSSEGNQAYVLNGTGLIQSIE